MNRLRCSVIFPVLESYEVVKRQILYMNGLIPENWEVIILDDGSRPSLVQVLNGFLEDHNTIPHFKLIETKDYRPWTQACATNRGAREAEGEYLLLMNIDHMLSLPMVKAIDAFNGDKMVFPRQWAVLNKKGYIVQDDATLFDYGWQGGKKHIGAGYGLQCIRREIYVDWLGGQDERFCGKYGNNDVDLSKRYAELHKQGKVQRAVIGPTMYVYPNPRADVKQIFHGLRRKAYDQ